jgi:gamma-glutamylcyclotransferase (GGCT)/AIG2-like uncharacterized protein YtfP
MVKLFSYGSNGSKQLGSRLGIDPDSLIPQSGYLEGFVRIFAGYNERCQGGVASVFPHKSTSCVYGSIFELSMDQVHIIDRWEKGYVRKKMNINVNSKEQVTCYVYVIKDHTFIAPPSDKYLKAIRMMLDETSRGAKSKVVIYTVDNLR